MTFAEDLFQATLALGKLEDGLFDIVTEKLGIEGFLDLTWDWYDFSVEFKNANKDLKLAPEQLEKLWELGFMRAWVCHEDGWETYYYKGGLDSGYRNKRT
jgi:hypothetical protein